MKSAIVLLFIFCCVAHFSGSAQMPTGWTYGNVNSKNIAYRLPSNYNTTSLKYPLVFFFHGNGEGGNDSAAIGVLFTAEGMGRTLIKPASTASPFIDSFIFVIVQTSSGSATQTRWPDVVVPIVTYFDNNFRVDTTIGHLTGYSQGAMNVMDIIAVPDGEYGGNYSYKLNRFTKNVIIASPYLTYYHTTDSAQRWAGRGYRGIIGENDGYTNSQHIPALNFLNSKGAYGNNRVVPGLGHVGNPGITDSAFSFLGTDTLTNIYKWFLSDTTGSGGSGGGGGGGGSGGSNLQAGFINATDAGSKEAACSQITGQKVFTNDGTISVGKKIYFNAAGTTGVADYGWHALSTDSAGNVLQSIQIWGDTTVHEIYNCSGGGGGGGSSCNPAFNYDTSLYIVPKHIYDYTGTDNEGDASLPHELLFNGIVCDGGNPVVAKVGAYSRMGTTGYGLTVWPFRGGLTYVLDLAGSLDPRDISKRDTLTGIELFLNSTLFPSDTAFFYNIDYAMLIANDDERLMHLSRQDSLGSPIGYIVHNNNSNLWKSVSLSNMPCRYLLIRMPTQDRTTYTSYCGFQEMRISGRKFIGTNNLIPQNTYTPNQTVPFGEFVGRNYSEQIDTAHFAFEGVTRLFARNSYYDTLRTTNTGNLFFMRPSDNEYIFKHQRSLHDYMGKTTIITFRGANLYVSDNQGVPSDKSIPINLPYQNPEDPNSFTRHASLHANIARVVGNGNATSRSQWIDPLNLFPGLNNDDLTYDEVGNESFHDFNETQSIPSYFAMMKPLYDSIAGFAPNFKLMHAGTYGLATNIYKTYWWFTQVCRTDKSAMIKAQSMHWYSGSVNAIKVNQFGETIYKTGWTAERDSNYQRYRQAQIITRSLPNFNLPLFITEHGYDEQRISATVNGNPFLSPFPNPTMQGFDSAQCRAVYDLRASLCAYASGVNALVLFTTVNPFYGATGNPVTFASSGIGAGNNTLPTKYLIYYARQFAYNYLKNYLHDTTYNIGFNAACGIKFRHKNNPDSVCYIAWMGVDSINALGSFSVSQNTLAGTPKMVQIQFGQAQGNEQNLTPSGGNYSIVTDWMPKMIFGLETNTSAPVIIKKVKKRAVRRKTG